VGWRSDLQKEYKMPTKQKPDGTVAGGSKRHAPRLCQLKTGRCLTGQYLNWTKCRLIAQCWWCPCRIQARRARPPLQGARLVEGLAEILWPEVKKETGRRKSPWKVQDLLADERCRKLVLDFLTTTDVGRLVSWTFISILPVYVSAFFSLFPLQDAAPTTSFA
jgi:hypothetical protein